LGRIERSLSAGRIVVSVVSSLFGGFCGDGISGDYLDERDVAIPGSLFGIIEEGECGYSDFDADTEL
jgi:hypothetical protein